MGVPILRSVKTVIRCRDFAMSMKFYVEVLGLRVVEQWQEPQGRGCIVELGGGLLEFYEMSEADQRFQEGFRRPVVNDKIDVQLKAESVEQWEEWLRGKWEFSGPETTPWGQRWVQMRDSDGVLVAIYE